MEEKKTNRPERKNSQKGQSGNSKPYNKGKGRYKPRNSDKPSGEKPTFQPRAPRGEKEQAPHSSPSNSGNANSANRKPWHKNSKFRHQKSETEKNGSRQNHRKTPYRFKDTTPITPPVVFAKCQICSAGISNENHALKVGENAFIHFECAIKKLKEIAQTSYSSYGKRLRYTYMGSNTFAIYLEQGGNPYSWKILQKIKIEKLLTDQKENIQEKI